MQRTMAAATWRRAAAGAAGIAGLALGAGSTAAHAGADSNNRTLFDRHRVILGWWPILGARAKNDPRTSSLRSLVNHAISAGYEGSEMSVEDIKCIFFSQSTPNSAVIAEAKAVAPAGFFTGGTYHIADGNESPYAGEACIADRPF
eukprot:COSAG05_NODE_11313_length_520_cov_0.558195_1_plen_145_part_10